MTSTADAVTTGEAPFGEHRTWYRITGDLAGSERPPLVILHGGPGAAHDYTLSMAELARVSNGGETHPGRAVIHYDQLGCGNSTHLPDADRRMWTVELFVDELANLVEHLDIGDDFHLLGQSWGGMLAPEYVLAHPRGVRSMTLCDSPASMQLWLEAANGLRTWLPADVQATLLLHEEQGTTDSPAYTEAMRVFYERHVCRIVPNPPEVAATFAQLEEDPTVYHTMNGPSEFHVIGSLKDWSVIDRLDGISVPTLVVAGAYDEATPATWQPFVEGIAGARSHVFADSSHMPHVEEPEAFLDVVDRFLDEADRGEPAA
ncbi:MAG: proline iminopeptidase-family hydrolase [Nocardioidaceae bacterium]